MERFVRSVVLPGDRVPATGGYPWDLPAVRGVRDAALDLDHDVVFLVGENAFLEAPERFLRALLADDGGVGGG